MQNLSFGENSNMDLTVETLSTAIQEWIRNDTGSGIVDSVEKLSRLSGVSVRTIDEIKNYNGGQNKPDPRLSTMLAIAKAIRSKLEINKKFDSE